MDNNSNNKTQHWKNVSEIELSYKTKVKAADRPVIRHSSDAYQVLLQCFDDNVIELFESVKALLMNRANMVLGVYQLSQGGITASVVDPRLLITAALKANAVGIILCHNHPSGHLHPSKSDEDMTQKIKTAAALLDIKLLDHLVISRTAYFSFADQGLL